MIKTELLQNRKEEVIAERVIRNLNLEFETLENEYQKTVQDIQDLDSEKKSLGYDIKQGQSNLDTGVLNIGRERT